MAGDFLFRLADVAAATGGVANYPPEDQGSRGNREDTVISTVAIDSRACTPGALFVALRGTATDGHRFVDDAVSRGAVAVVVAQGGTPPGVGVPVVEVPDTLRALQALARWYVATELASVVRIAVTGSNGKTTTKEMIRTVLTASREGVAASEGNLNSETGVPLAVFRTPRDVKYAVFETGMNHPGEMEDLAEILHPDIAVITGIGTAHIGHLGSRDAIAAEKKMIAARFSHRQTLIIPEADDYREFLSRDVAGTVRSFGPESQGIEVVAPEDAGAPGSPWALRVDSQVFALGLPGYHNALNALAALAVADVLGVDRRAACTRLGEITVPPGRSCFVRGAHNRLVLDDSYNASPESVVAALDAVAAAHRTRAAGPLVVVLGSMKELGEYSPEGHRRVLHHLEQIHADHVVLVGDEWQTVVSPGALAGAVICNDTAQARGELERRLGLAENETVLIKGSRVWALEGLREVLGV